LENKTAMIVLGEEKRLTRKEREAPLTKQGEGGTILTKAKFTEGLGRKKTGSGLLGSIDKPVVKKKLCRSAD